MKCNEGLSSNFSFKCTFRFKVFNLFTLQVTLVFEYKCFGKRGDAGRKSKFPECKWQMKFQKKSVHNRMEMLRNVKRN